MVVPKLDFRLPSAAPTATLRLVEPLSGQALAAIDTELRNRGLDGSGLFRSPAEGLRQALDVLRSYGVEPLATGARLPYGSVLATARGSTGLPLGRTNPRDPRRPQSLSGTQLMLHWRAGRRGYTVTVYVT